jgi:hypothetical protein
MTDIAKPGAGISAFWWIFLLLPLIFILPLFVIIIPLFAAAK